MKGTRIHHGRVTFAACMFIGLLPASLPAQDATGDEAIEEVVVTGSRIGRSNSTTPIPVTVIDARSIGLDGKTRTADILNELPQIRSTQTDANSNINREQEAGSAFIDLRGLGIDRTLVLIDGRRQVGGRPGSAALDTNTIPTALVERVEIITGGASAVYGADAVSGVVNFIMKDNFEGLRFDAQTGVSGEGDGERYQFSITGGSNFPGDRGNVYFNASFDDSRRVVGQDRDYANRRIRFASNPDDTGPDDGIPDLILFENTGFISTPPSGRVNFDEFGTLREDLGGPFTFDANGNLVAQDLGTLVESFLSIGGNNAGDLSRFDLLQIPVRRKLLTSGLSYDLHEKVTFFAKAKFAQAEARTAEQTTFSLPNFEPIEIQRDNPFVPQALEDMLVNEGIDSFFVSRTNIDHGRRRSNSTRDTAQFYVGLEGALNANLDYTVHYQHGRTDISTEFINRQVPSRFRQALDAVADPVTGEPVCADPTGGCVPLNVLGPDMASPEALAFAYADYSTSGQLTQEVVNATVTGDTLGLFEAPGGPVGFAAGFEYREESTSTNEGFLRNSGDLFSFAPLDDTSGEFDVTEFFAEVNLPLLTGAPFAESLNLDGAVRFGNYSTVGDTTAWKVGGDWAPSDDVRFRFTVSTAVRAPNIGELFAPTDLALQFLIDPCDADFLDSGSANRRDNCAAAGLPPDFESQSQNRNNRIVTGGNPDLDEEEADTLTFGAVFTPSFVENFTLAIDFWDIEIKDAINSFPAQAIANNCYDAASLDNPFCELITRQGNGQFDEIRSTLFNVASFDAAGTDIEAAWLWDMRERGTLNLKLVATYLDELTFFGQEGGTGDREAGELGDPEWSFNLRGTWDLEDWSVSVEERFQGNQVIDLAEPAEVRSPNDTGTKWYTDVQLRYRFSDTAMVYLGIDNLFGTEPPDIAQVPEIRSFTGDAIGYDQIGRYFRLGASVGW